MSDLGSPSAREPVRPLPAELLAEHGALRLQPVVQRRAAQRPAAVVLLERPGHRVVLGVRLQRARAHPVGVGVRCGRSGGCRPPTGRTAASPPTTHSASALPAPPPEAMPKALKPAPTKKSRTSGASPRMKLPSGVKLSGPLISLLDAGVGQRRHAAERQLHDRREMVPVRSQQLELEVLREAVDRPGDRVRLVAAHHQAADLLLVVREPVGIAQRRQVAGDACDRLGDDVLVLHRRPAARSRRPCARPRASTGRRRSPRFSQSMRPCRGHHGGHASVARPRCRRPRCPRRCARPACARPWPAPA